MLMITVNLLEMLQNEINAFISVDINNTIRISTSKHMKCFMKVKCIMIYILQNCLHFIFCNGVSKIIVNILFTTFFFERNKNAYLKLLLL